MRHTFTYRGTLLIRNQLERLHVQGYLAHKKPVGMKLAEFVEFAFFEGEKPEGVPFT